MKLKFDGCTLTVTKEDSDPKFSGQTDAKGESHLLFHVKKALNADPSIVGLPPQTLFIKKRMWKDGNLVDDMQQYVRTKKPIKDKGCLCFYNNHWAICGLDDDFREFGQAKLQAEWL